jgi:type VI secretion system protein ImpK
MAETTTSTAAPSLADLCGDLLAFALQLKRSSDPGDADAMRQKVDEQFRTLELKARQADVPAEDVTQAKYAMAAFIDEMILTSSWGLKDSWADKPLQLAYFNDFSAGEEFYNKIDTLRGAKKITVMEVYYLCLALGFRGKYVDLQGMEKKKVLMDAMLREIRGTSTAPAPGTGGLSPSWQPPDALPGIVKAFPAWFVAAACGLLVILLFVLLSTLLGSSAEKVVNIVK